MYHLCPPGYERPPKIQLTCKNKRKEITDRLLSAQGRSNRDENGPIGKLYFLAMKWTCTGTEIQGSFNQNHKTALARPRLGAIGCR